MKKLTLILLSALTLISVAGCKSTKNDCDAYGYVIDKDSIIIATEHVNYDNKCHETVVIENEIIDTFYLKNINY